MGNLLKMRPGDYIVLNPGIKISNDSEFLIEIEIPEKITYTSIEITENKKEV